MKGKIILWMIVFISLISIAYAANYRIWTTCYEFECTNHPLIIWIENETDINTSTLTQLQVLYDGVDHPFQWHNNTQQDYIIFLINQTDNETSNYTLRTDSGTTGHNVSILFPPDSSVGLADLSSNVRTFTEGGTWDNYFDSTCVFDNCAEMTIDNTQTYWGDYSLKVTRAGAGDDAVDIEWSNEQGWWSIMMWDDATDNSVFMTIALDDTGGGNILYPGGVNTGGGQANAATNYMCYNGGAYVDSGVTRTTGWHEIQIYNNGVGTTSWIDGVQCLNNDADVANVDVFRIQASDHAATTYFDHIMHSPLGLNTTNTTINYSLELETGATNFTVSVTDAWNSSTINVFNVTVNGVEYTATTGTATTLLLSNDTSLYNIEIESEDGYFNRTYTNYNISLSGNLATTLHQAEVCFNASAKISEEAIPDVNFDIESTQQTCYNISSGTYNITAFKNSWNNQTEEITIIALDNTTETIENLTSANLTVYARDANSSAYLINYSLNITSITYPAWGGERVTDTVNYSFFLINGSYTITIDAPGYSLTDAEVNVSVTGDGTYTFWLNVINTVNVTFLNEDDGTVFSVIPINATFILDDTNATIASTTNGRLWLENMDPGDYEIRYYGTDCAERSYFFTLTNRSYVELNLYLLNDTGSEDITNTLYDEYGNRLEGYIIKLLRYYASLNGYVTVDEGTTNSEGQTVLRAIRNSPYYKFRIVDATGEVLKTTSSTQIYDLTITHYITLGESVSAPLNNILGVSYSLTYLTASDQFKYTWNNADGTSLNAELRIYQINDGLNTLINSSSTSSDSGTIYLGIPVINGTTYKALAYVTFSGDTEETLIDTLTQTFDEGVATFGRAGLFITILIIIVLSLLFAVNPAIPFIGVPAAVALTKIARFHGLEWTWIVSLFAVGLLLAYLTRDKT